MQTTRAPRNHNRISKLQGRIESRTGVIWGRYQLPPTFMANGRDPQAAFYFVLHPKGGGLVRIEAGIGRRGYYLSWGER
jgi:hypothetical protein